MQPQTFIAESAADAIAQIRGQLGPEAVVLSVKQLPATGLGRFWQKPRIEVTAHLPNQSQPSQPDDPLDEIKRQLFELRQQIEQRPGQAAELPALDILGRGLPNMREPAPLAAKLAGAGDQPRLVSSPHQHRPSVQSRLDQILDTIGITPVLAEQVLDLMRQTQSDTLAQTPAQEVELVCSTLRRLWRARDNPGTNVHVFVGPPGSGKTTVLCKWLAKAVLVDNRQARVWRLDGTGPNSAESLSVYSEILGVPVDRFRSESESLDPSELLFIDLPGVDWKEPAALEALRQQVGDLPAGHVHLVLNAAYEVPLLLAQARAFSRCPVFDIIVTHLDEEKRWGKLWNIVLGTNYSLGWLGAGQNIPGDFHPAAAQMLFSRQFHPG